MQTHHASVSELMHMPVLTLGPSARAHDVLALAQAQAVHHFPIVQHQKLLGLVCTCDLEELAPDAGVLQVAWRHVITLPHDGSSSDAARLMAMQGVGSIVITDAEGVCGIVTREDLILADPELDQLLWAARCASCGARSHLRPGPDGSCNCQGCRSKAQG